MIVSRRICQIWLIFGSLFAFSSIGWAAGAEIPAQEGGIRLEPLLDLLTDNPWVRGGIVILFAVILASLFTWLVFKVLRLMLRKSRLRLDEQAVLLLRVPVYYTLLAAGVYAGLEVMPLSEQVLLLSSRLLKTVGWILWIVFFSRLTTMLLQRLAGLSKSYNFLQNRTLTLFDNAAKIFILGLGVYGLFVLWNIDMTAWLASAGIAGIAIGFAAKDTLSNLFAGVFIIADAPYKVGDYVVLDNSSRGKVTNIGLRSTRILTRDDIEITIPNSIIGNSTIVNQSGGHHVKMRLRVKIGVAYGSDIDLVRNILVEIAGNEPLICDTPEPRVRFRTFGASSLDFELLCWIDDPELRGRALDLLNEAIYKRFNEEKIEIPFAQQDIYIKSLPAGSIPNKEVERSEE